MFLVCDDVQDDSEEHLEDEDDNYPEEEDSYLEDNSQILSSVAVLVQMIIQQRMVKLATLATLVVRERN